MTKEFDELKKVLLEDPETQAEYGNPSEENLGFIQFPVDTNYVDLLREIPMFLTGLACDVPEEDDTDLNGDCTVQFSILSSISQQGEAFIRTLKEDSDKDSVRLIIKELRTLYIDSVNNFFDDMTKQTTVKDRRTYYDKPTT